MFKCIESKITWRIIFSVYETVSQEREENVEAFVDTERSGLEADRRSSIYRRNSSNYPRDNYQIENGKPKILLQVWDLTIHIFMSTTHSVLKSMTTSPSEHFPSLLNSSPNTNLVSNHSAMAPNNTTLNSQPTNQFRPHPANSQKKEEATDSTTEYSIPRMFLEHSKLHAYLARKEPNLIRLENRQLITLEERCYTLYDVSLYK